MNGGKNKYFLIIMVIIIVSCNKTRNHNQSVATIEALEENLDELNAIIHDLQVEKNDCNNLENPWFYMSPDSIVVPYFKNASDEIKIPNNRLYDYFEFNITNVSIYDFMDGRCNEQIASKLDENILRALEKHRYSGCLIQYKSLSMSDRFCKSLLLENDTKVDLWVVLYNNLAYVIKCKRL